MKLVTLGPYSMVMLEGGGRVIFSRGLDKPLALRTPLGKWNLASDCSKSAKAFLTRFLAQGGTPSTDVTFMHYDELAFKVERL